jgi:hypothetical protein
MDDTKYDGLFLNIISSTKGIDGFFNALFGFMRRKTDFFSDSEMSQEKLQEYFKIHLEHFKQDKERQELIEKKKKEKEAEERRQKEAAAKVTEETNDDDKVEEITAEEAERIMKA